MFVVVIFGFWLAIFTTWVKTGLVLVIAAVLVEGLCTPSGY